MKEQLISLETAKLAKEKEFNEITGGDCWVKTLEGKIIHNSERHPIEHDRVDNDYYLAQPTQSLLQRWLREKHNIHVIAMINDTDGVTDLPKGEYNYYYLVFFWYEDIYSRACAKEYYPPAFKPKALYNKYEDCLEKGLLEALKQIKVKNNE